MLACGVWQDDCIDGPRVLTSDASRIRHYDCRYRRNYVTGGSGLRPRCRRWPRSGKVGVSSDVGEARQLLQPPQLLLLLLLLAMLVPVPMLRQRR